MDKLTSSSNGPAPQKSRQPLLSLRNRLLIITILFALLPVLITGTVAAYISSQGLRNASFDQLESISTLKIEQIRSWLVVLQNNLDLIFATSNVRDNVQQLLNGGSTAQEVDRVALRNSLANYNATAGYFTEVFVMDRDGKIILSTDETQEGKIQASQAYFLEGQKGRYINPPTYDVSLASFSIVIVQPYVNNSNQIIGVLAGRVNLSTLNDIMLQRAGLGETGETYIVSANFAALTPLKFSETEIGRTYVRTQGTTNAIQTQQVGSGNYLDYRGVAVVGDYHWVPELQVAVISEQDESEALSAANTVLLTAFGLMIITVFLAAIVAFLFTQSITAPITQLVRVAENVSQGNLDEQAVILQQDEIGTLAAAFNNMTGRLRDLIGSLEQRVADRTKALATAAEVSRRISTINDEQELAVEVVNQLQTAFNYYHAHIYLLEENGENLVMTGGTGEAGQILLQRGHKIARGRGLVGRAAETKESVLVPDTLQTEGWLPNPLLPETKAEIAVPILAGDRVLGVLDVQNNVANSLSQQDVDTIESIASQVAIAIQNIRQFQATQKIANDLSVVANVGIATSTIADSNQLLQEVVDLAKKSFRLYHAHIYLINEDRDTLVLTAGADEVGRQMVAEGRSIALDSEKSLVARAARTGTGVVVNDVRADPDFLPNPLLPETRSEMAVPMLVAGQVIGVLDVQADTLNRFTEVDINIKTTLAAQVAIALQNARSFAQARQQAERETTLNQISQRIQSATDIETALQIAARELGHALGMKPTAISLSQNIGKVEEKESIK
jgi:GAF domain-containing protein/HAMP domain-containing protein